MVIVNDNYLIKAKVLLGQFFDVPEEDVFIELREPTSKALFKMEEAFKSKDSMTILTVFIDLLPSLITAHNLMRSETEKQSNAEVAAIVENKMDIFMHVLNKYKDDVLFTLGKKSGTK
jgi:hypothetical protein